MYYKMLVQQNVILSQGYGISSYDTYLAAEAFGIHLSGRELVNLTNPPFWIPNNSSTLYFNTSSDAQAEQGEAGNADVTPPPELK